MNWIKTNEAVPPTSDFTDNADNGYYRMSKPVFCYAPFSNNNRKNSPTIETMPCQATFVQTPDGDHWACWSINGDDPSDEVFNTYEINEWMPFPKPSMEVNQ